MLDLSSLPKSAFVGALEYNLERLRSVFKVYDHFLGAVLGHLEADAVWLRRIVRERHVVSEDFEHGIPRHRDDTVIEAFVRQQRPDVPRNLLLSPIKVNGRLVGVVGAERHEAGFARGQGRSLNRLAYVLARDLARREEDRHRRVLDAIKEKIVGELRPRDLAYQILDGLHQLLHFDHSAALLIYEPERSLLRVDAEKIAWTKSKSAYIGHEIPLSHDVEAALAYPARITMTPAVGGSEDVFHPLFESLYFHRGGTLPEPTSILCAPLHFDSELLGVLKLAALERLPFDARDQEVTERFLPAAAVALRNARERVSLENQALQAEIRAGLVTLAKAVSHDVNNAMGSLLPLAEQVRDDLLRGSPNHDTLVEDMNVIVDKAALCKQIFGNMLKLGSSRRGQGPVDVHATLREMLSVLRSHARARGAELTLDLGDDVPVITFSKAHLERIVWNLVTNAAEAGTTIIVQTRASGEGGAVVNVIDDGPGLPADELSKVMQPFYSTKEEGTGLGLPICRALAWQYGGNLSLESDIGKGTRALLTLPPVSET